MIPSKTYWPTSKVNFLFLGSILFALFSIFLAPVMVDFSTFTTEFVKRKSSTLKGVLSRALERVFLAPKRGTILSTKIGIVRITISYNIPIDIVDFGSSIAMDELRFPERQASTTPKLLFSTESSKNLQTFPLVSCREGQISSNFRTAHKKKKKIIIKGKTQNENTKNIELLHLVSQSWEKRSCPSELGES